MGRDINLLVLPPVLASMDITLCECGCGNPAPIATMTSTRSGWTKGQPKRFISGHNKARLRHGHKRKGQPPSPEYVAYRAAKQRCEYPPNKCFADYGGRGIRFLFATFEEFYAELGAKPSPTHSVDRINTDGNYEPGNVRWATPSEQMKNRRPWFKKNAACRQ